MCCVCTYNGTESIEQFVHKRRGRKGGSFASTMNGGKGKSSPPQPQQPREGPWATWVMGHPVAPSQADQAPAGWIPVEHVTPAAGYPATTTNPMYKNSFTPAPPVTGVSSSSTAYGGRGPSLDRSSNPYPYVQATPVPGSAGKSPMETLLKMLERCGRKLEDNTRKAGTAVGNVWYHLKTSPNPTDAAMARLAQGTKVIAEGGRDKVFQQTFGILPGEQLRKAYACYLSTSSGPVIGTIYISTARVAFCSDNPLCHNIAPGQQEWIYYKVVVPLDQLKAVNPSCNIRNPVEKYIQIVTADDHEFWFVGFVSYDKALKHLTEALQHHKAGHSKNQHK